MTTCTLTWIATGYPPWQRCSADGPERLWTFSLSTFTCATSKDPSTTSTFGALTPASYPKPEPYTDCFSRRLDVSQHMSLCRHYVRELRRSVLLETPELEKATASRRTSQILDNFDLRDGGDARESPQSERSQDQRLSAFLRTEKKTRATSESDSHSGKSRSEQGHEQPPRPSFMTSNFGGETTDSSTPNNYTSPQHTVNRSDIRASAEKILYTFLLPGSEREIILPQGILADVTESIEEQGRDDPEVFDAAKDYVFQAMERDAYPGFLRSKALGNLVPLSLMLRLTVGLLAMFGAFWTAFVLIFLNESRRTRCWVCLHALRVATHPILNRLPRKFFRLRLVSMHWHLISTPWTPCLHWPATASTRLAALPLCASRTSANSSNSVR